MKSECKDSLKFKRLCKRLKMPSWKVVGILETIWQHGYAEGSDVVGTIEDLEIILDWDDDLSVLESIVAILVEESWLDLHETPSGSDLLIHDFWHHAPQYVNRRKERRSKRETTIDNSHQTGQSIDSPPVTSQRLVTDYPLTQSSASVTSSTQPNPTQPNPTQPNRNDVETAFAERGIVVEPSGGSGPPAERPPETIFVEGLLSKSSASLNLSPTHRETLYRLCRGDGEEAFCKAFRAAEGAIPRRVGKGFVAYVESVLGSMAGKKVKVNQGKEQGEYEQPASPGPTVISFT